MNPTSPDTHLRSYGGRSGAERVAERRDRLIEAGLECYGTVGFAGTGVKDVCREARLTDRYFYESFRDAGALFVATFDHVTATLFVRVAQAVGAVPPDPVTQARAAIGAFVEALAADPRKARLVFSEAPAAGPDAAHHMRETLRRFADLIVATARPHAPQDTPELTLELNALALVGAVERVIVEWHDGRLPATTHEVTEHLVQLFLGAARATGTLGEER